MTACSHLAINQPRRALERETRRPWVAASGRSPAARSEKLTAERVVRCSRRICRARWNPACDISTAECTVDLTAIPRASTRSQSAVVPQALSVDLVHAGWPRSVGRNDIVDRDATMMREDRRRRRNAEDRRPEGRRGYPGGASNSRCFRRRQRRSGVVAVRRSMT